MSHYKHWQCHCYVRESKGVLLDKCCKSYSPNNIDIEGTLTIMSWESSVNKYRHFNILWQHNCHQIVQQQQTTNSEMTNMRMRWFIWTKFYYSLLLSSGPRRNNTQCKCLLLQFVCLTRPSSSLVNHRVINYSTIACCYLVDLGGTTHNVNHRVINYSTIGWLTMINYDISFLNAFLLKNVRIEKRKIQGYAYAFNSQN